VRGTVKEFSIVLLESEPKEFLLIFIQFLSDTVYFIGLPMIIT